MTLFGVVDGVGHRVSSALPRRDDKGNSGQASRCPEKGLLAVLVGDGQGGIAFNLTPDKVQ